MLIPHVNKKILIINIFKIHIGLKDSNVSLSFQSLCVILASIIMINATLFSIDLPPHLQ